MRQYSEIYLIITLGIVAVCLGEPPRTHKTESPLPTIRYGDACAPGTVYQMDCNVCRCNQKKNLVCTKKYCFDRHTTRERNPFKDEHSTMSTARSVTQKQKPNKQEPSTSRNATKKLKPNKEEPCPPGKVYEDDCRTCVCNSQSKPICTETGDCNQGGLKLTHHKKNIQGLLRMMDLETLPALDHLAATCKPGGLYRLDCNSCFCRRDGNLMCDRNVCANYEAMVQREIAKYTGRACQQTALVQDQQPTECVHCSCRGGRLDCRLAADCVPQWMRSRYPSVDIGEQRCEPGGVYRSHCNKCYCQVDGSMRCTQKGCLNFKQAQQLLERQKALDRNGL